MKPYGRENKVLGGKRNWKRDYHIHRKNRKIENWWEGYGTIVSRKSLKQNLKKQIEKL